eukprot:NODE_479_length_1536_cov_297.737340.p2 GENE.NODE_479_length_1536_cov_297.737340~~NODE_479_length_1536_cov_297.737340.p2  ORF type:complete len:212 (+),score=44.92 NODE_479_length_1536_cov_297.737340:883-1518(+)
MGVVNEPNYILAAILPIFRLAILGDFDLSGLEGADTVYIDTGGVLEPLDPAPSRMYAAVLALSFIVAVVISVFLMNLFVGILSANYDRYSDLSPALFVRERATSVIVYNSRWWLRRLPRRVAWLVPKDSADVEEDRKYLWIAVKKNKLGDDITSMRTWTENMTKNVVREEGVKLRMTMRKEVAKLQRESVKLERQDVRATRALSRVYNRCD